jgi:hypothetical protein
MDSFEEKTDFFFINFFPQTAQYHFHHMACLLFVFVGGMDKQIYGWLDGW